MKIFNLSYPETKALKSVNSLPSITILRSVMLLIKPPSSFKRSKSADETVLCSHAVWHHVISQNEKEQEYNIAAYGNILQKV